MLSDENYFDMRRIHYILISYTLFLFSGCWDRKPINNADVYGNTFIQVYAGDFKAPESWVTHHLFDSAFQLRLPKFMCQTESLSMRGGCATTIFTYCDTAKQKEYHYGRIGIDYFKCALCGFNKADDYIDYTDIISLFAPILKRSLSGGKKYGDYTVPDAELLNGPFYDSHLLYDQHIVYAYDVYYRRKSHTKGESPISCHIFYLMNGVEAVLLTVSYHDKDSVLFSNLFNCIKTFKWKTIHD